MNIKFLGASMSVTGSCHLITTDKYEFLLDCGQFQGGKTLEQLNYGSLGFDAHKIDFVILSHAHIDHSGRIPLLVNRGFSGRIYCTKATADLADIMLKDSGYIHEKEAEWSNKKARRQGRPLVEPLYTMDDAAASLEYLYPVPYDEFIDINDEIRLCYRDAGHILGSTIVELWIKEGDTTSKLVFSGDLGVKNELMLKDPAVIEEADYLIMEATYGNRTHETSAESFDEFVQIILKTIRRGGTVLIPSFAIGRTQELIYELNRRYESDEEFKSVMEDIMVYVDSPLATSATEVFRRNAHDFDDETRDYIEKGGTPLDFKNLRFTRSSDESKQLNDLDAPKIIIAASGMADAGRIKHHLKHHLWNPKTSVIFVGYQVPGTLGRLIVSGNKDVHIYGEKIHIAAEIYSLEGFSGHADRNGLLEWLSGFKKMPKKVFLVHGEEGAKHAFAATVKQALGYTCTVVEDVSEFNLEADIRISIDDVRDKVSTGEQMYEIREKLGKVSGEFDLILSTMDHTAEKGLPPEEMNAILNNILELEKATKRLGTLVSNKEA